MKLYSYDPNTSRFTMEVAGNDYTFSYDIEKATGKNFKDESGKLIARTYKGFRDSLGIAPSSYTAQLLVNEIKKARDILQTVEEM